MLCLALCNNMVKLFGAAVLVCVVLLYEPHREAYPPLNSSMTSPKSVTCS